MRDHPLRDIEGSVVKVFATLPPADWHNWRSESLWAAPLGNSLFQLRNVPFYLMGISYDDVVQAKDKDKDLWISGVHSRGGHSTYRFITLDGVLEEQWRPYWQPMADIECTYERATDRLFSVDIPPNVDIYNAYSLLDAGEKAGIWGFQEAHCGHPLRNMKS